MVALAQRCGLAGLVAERLTLPAKGGVNAHVKVPALIAGMVAGADSIDDMDLLRHGGMARLFGGVGAPRRSGRSYRPSPSAMSGSSTASPRRWRPSSAAGARCSLGAIRSRTSMLMTP